jgi:hypothetical protein
MTLALFLVLVGAKLAAMGGHGVPLTAWSIIAFTWQEAVIAVTFGLLERATAGSRTRLALIAAYWGLIAYVAINIPIGRALATPLTWPMLRATGGALADSLLLHATWTNVVLLAAVVAGGLFLPRVVRRLPGAPPRVAASCALLLITFGPFASDRAGMQGRERNALIALVESAFPRVDAASRTGDWRLSAFGQGRGDDLTWLSGGARGRNVVMISLESTGAQYLPLYGGRGDVMPALSAMARDSIVFERAYAPYPESIKGLFSVLCSTFPAFDVTADVLSRVPCVGLPARLRDAGYATALFHSGRFDYLGMQAVIANRGYDTLEDAGDIGGNRRSSFGVDEPSTVARILAWIDSLPREHPFFVTYLPIAGHHPYESPSSGPFPNDRELGRYLNALRYGDASLGVLMDGLRRRGLYENTLWIIYGDHGEAFGQHDGNYGHTFLLFDENVRVPFIISAPGLTPGQQRVRRPVSLVDTAPTVLDLLGIPVPHDYQGSSMLDATQRMALFFTDYSLPLAGLVDGRWKAVHDLSTGRTRLFDLEKDPGETYEVSAPQRAEWYGRTLQDWSAAQKNYVLMKARR